MSKVRNVRARQARRSIMREWDRSDFGVGVRLAPSLVPRVMCKGLSGRRWKARTLRARLAMKARRRRG